MNRKKHTTPCHSKYKGVTWYKKLNKWAAQITGPRPSKIKYYLGLFVSEKEAAKAYDLRAKELFGEYAKPNL